MVNAPAGLSLRVETEHAYAYSRFPRTGDFTIVPMLADQQPDSPAAAKQIDATLRAIPETDGIQVRISLRQAPRAHLHFRYDPALWQPAGAGIVNTFPDSTDCISFSHIAEDDLLNLNAIPTSQDSRGHIPALRDKDGRRRCAAPTKMPGATRRRITPRSGYKS